MEMSFTQSFVTNTKALALSWWAPLFCAYNLDTAPIVHDVLCIIKTVMLHPSQGTWWLAWKNYNKILYKYIYKLSNK